MIKEMKINLGQKKFILKTLIPFILRAAGRGFAMETLLDYLEPGTSASSDGVERIVPACGTVACLKGSVKHLRPGANAYEVLGLTYAQGDGLFYRWVYYKNFSGYGWPESYARRYSKAKTPIGKARVAAALLREGVRTNWEVLNRP